MKKSLLKILLVVFILSFLGCGTDSSFKEGPSKNILEKFLKTVQEGKKEQAYRFALTSLKDATDIKKFIETKIDEIGDVSEEKPSIKRFMSIENDRLIEEKKNLIVERNALKEKLNKTGEPKAEDVDKLEEKNSRIKQIDLDLDKLRKVKNQDKKIKNILKNKFQPGFERTFNETFFLAKLTRGAEENIYIIFYFNSQNLIHITGILPLNRIKSSLVYNYDMANVQKQVFKFIVENI